jgi:hypothetical protein
MTVRTLRAAFSPNRLLAGARAEPRVGPEMGQAGGPPVVAAWASRVAAEPVRRSHGHGAATIVTTGPSLPSSRCGASAGAIVKSRCVFRQRRQQRYVGRAE